MAQILPRNGPNITGKGQILPKWSKYYQKRPNITEKPKHYRERCQI